MASASAQPLGARLRSWTRRPAASLVLLLSLATGTLACAGPAGSGTLETLDAAELPSSSRNPSPAAPSETARELEGLGGLDMMPSLLDAIVPSGCDLDNPMSSCQ